MGCMHEALNHRHCHRYRFHYDILCIIHHLVVQAVGGVHGAVQELERVIVPRLRGRSVAHEARHVAVGLNRLPHQLFVAQAAQRGLDHVFAVFPGRDFVHRGLGAEHA